MRLTQRFYGLLGLGTCLALGLAVISPGSLNFAILAALLWDLGLLVAVALDRGQVKLQQIQVQRELPAKLSIGRENSITLRLTAAELKPRSAQLQVTDLYPVKLSLGTLPAPQSTGETALSEAIEASEAGLPRPLLRSLPRSLQLRSKSSQTLTYTVVPKQREALTWGSIQLRQLGPWGLVWRQWQVDQPQTTKVYPDLVALRELTIRLTLQSAGSLRVLRRQGMGTEFAELRDYVGGDDPRLIDWKATARRGRPLVRVLEPEQEQTLLILIDRGRLMTARVEGLQRFDWALNAALALAKTGLHRGDRVGMGVFDRQMTLWMPPARGEMQMMQFLEKLTPIQPELLEPDYLGAVSNVIAQQTRRALVVMLTDVVDAIASAELLGALTRLAPRYLPFCVALRDPQIDVCAQTEVETIGAAYSRAVALDLLLQRRVALGQLKQKGTMVLDAPASQVSSRLVDEYLRLKARNRL